MGKGLSQLLLLLVLLLSPLFATSTENVSIEFPGPAEVEFTLSQSIPQPLSAPWGGSLERDLQTGGRWSEHDFHVDVPASFFTSFGGGLISAFIGWVFDDGKDNSGGSDIGSKIGSFIEGLLNQFLTGQVNVYRNIEVTLLADMVRGFEVYESHVKNNTTNNFHILFSTDPSYASLVAKKDSLKKVLMAYTDVIVSANDWGLQYSPTTIARLQSVVLSIRGWDAENFRNKYPELISRLGLEEIICTYEEDNKTKRYVCGFKRVKDPEEIPPFPYQLISSIERAFEGKVDADFLGAITLSALGAHDGYIALASDLVKASNDALSAYSENVTNLTQTYRELFTSGYCKLESSPPTVCGESPKLCGDIAEFVEKTREGQSYASEAYEYFNTFQESMEQGEPNWEYWARGIIGVEGTISFAQNIVTKWDTTLLNIMSNVKSAFNRINNNLREMELTMQRYGEEKYKNIDTLYTNRKVVLLGGIKDLFDNYTAKLTTLVEQEEDVKESWEGKDTDYIYHTCTGLTSIEDAIPPLKNDIITLEDLAKDTVAYMRNQALGLIEKGKEMGIDMSAALEQFRAGETATLLGEKYYRYHEAYQLASLALMAYVPENNESLNNESIQELLAYVQSLIERAKRDGIDVSEEEARLSMVLNNPDSDAILSTLLDIKRSIVEKASIAYSDLPGLREEIYSYINQDPEFFRSILLDIQSAEAGVVFNGYIDYEEGLGRLAQLREAYRQALKEILEMIKSVGILEGDFYVNIPSYVPFNQEVGISVYASYYNPYPFDVEGEQEVDLPISMDFTAGDEKLRITGRGTTASIAYNLGPFEGAVVDEDVPVILGTITESGERKYGELGKVYVEKVYLADVLSDQPTYVLPEKGEVSVNGQKVGFTDRIAGKLLSPTAEVGVSFIAGEEYTWERTDSTMVEKGGYREVSYDIVVNNPIEGLEYLTIVITSGEKDATFESDYYVEKGDNFLKVVSPPKGVFTIHVVDKLPLDPGDDLKKRLEDLEDKLNDSGMLDDYKDELDEIEKDIENGNYEEANEKLNDLEDEVNRKLEENNRYGPLIQNILSEMDQELAMLQEAIAKLGKEDPYGLGEIWSSRKRDVERLKAQIEELVKQNEFRQAYDLGRSYTRSKFLTKLLQIARDMKKEKDGAMREYYKAKVESKEVEELHQQFERLYSRVRTSVGNSYASLSELQGVLVKLKAKIEDVLKNKDKLKSEEERKFEEKKEEVEDLLEEYEEYYNKAKELGLEEYFSRSPKYYRDKINSLPTGSQRAYKYSTAQLEEMKKAMQEDLSKIEELAKEKARRAFALYHSIKDMLDPNVRAKADALADELQAALEKGDYMLALYKAEELLKLLSKVKIKKSVNPILIIVAVVVGGGGLLAYHFLKNRGGGDGSSGGFSLKLFGEKKEKKLRKLKRGSEELPPNSV